MPLNAINASQKLKSINISSSKQETDYKVQVPKGLESGAAGEATSFLNFITPVVRGIAGDTSPSNLTVWSQIHSSNTNVNNFNIYKIIGSGSSLGQNTIIKILF